MAMLKHSLRVHGLSVGGMNLARTASLMALLTVIVFVTGCSSDPYVYREHEFDRTLVTFAKEPTNRDAIIVCYARNAPSRAEAGRLAAAECAKDGKTAVYGRSTYGKCPLTVPFEAHYACK